MVLAVVLAIPHALSAPHSHALDSPLAAAKPEYTPPRHGAEHKTVTASPIGSAVPPPSAAPRAPSERSLASMISLVLDAPEPRRRSAAPGTARAAWLAIEARSSASCAADPPLSSSGQCPVPGGACALLSPTPNPNSIAVTRSPAAASGLSPASSPNRSAPMPCTRLSRPWPRPSRTRYPTTNRIR